MARREVLQPRCDLCNRFISWLDCRNAAVMWTPYGQVDDIDPPEDEWAHLHCWLNTDEATRNLIRRISWMGPSIRDHPEYNH